MNFSLCIYKLFRACLHGGGGPQVGQIGKVTHLGGVTRLST